MREKQPTPEEKAATFEAYAEIGRYFWQQINALAPEDRAALRAYTRTVVELKDLYDRYLALGYMGELSLWLGLKEDAPATAAEAYGQGIRVSYPKVFEESNEPRKHNS